MTTLPRINHVRVRTPEGVVFTYPLAGPVVRCLAWLIDALVVVAICSTVGSILAIFQVVSADWTTGFLTLAYFVISTGYGVVLEWRWRGQTLGKRLLRLRVVDQEGLPLTASQVLLRNLLRAVDVLPLCYLIGGGAMMLSPRAQRLGDIAAGTIVVRHRRTREPDFTQLFAGRYNSLRAQPHLAARLRQQVSPDLAAAGVDALLRRDALEPAARVAVFGELAAVFRRMVPYPPEIAAGMPDEAYVRNVVEIVHGWTEPTLPERVAGSAARSGDFSAQPLRAGE